MKLKILSEFDWVTMIVGTTVWRLCLRDERQKYIAYVNKGEWIVWNSPHQFAVIIAEGTAASTYAAKRAAEAALTEHGMLVAESPDESQKTNLKIHGGKNV